MSKSKRRFTEDELAKAVMETVGTVYTDWEPEVHYNHYGDRGVVDLIQTEEYDQEKTLRVYELKCEPAIENSTGANEILRQFNRHRTYFFKGSDYKATDYSSVTFELTFAATQACYEHVRDNWAQYKHISANRNRQVQTDLLFRTHQADCPFIPRDGKILKTDYIEDIDGFEPEVKR